MGLRGELSPATGDMLGGAEYVPSPGPQLAVVVIPAYYRGQTSDLQIGHIGRLAQLGEHQLFQQLARSRRKGFRLADGVWLRLVDVGAALSSRSYSHDGSVAAFERSFGGLRSRWELGCAVAQLFANGGRIAWVVAVPAGTPLTEGLRRLDAADSLGLLCLPGESDADVLRTALEYVERRSAFLHRRAAAQYCR